MINSNSGLVFYAFGHFCQSRGIFDRKLPPVALLVFILLWIIETRFVHFRMYLMGYDYLYPIGVTFACGMTIVLVRCAKFINPPRWLFAKGLSLFGFYSLEVMCCHQVVRTILSCLLKDYELTNWRQTIIIFLGTIILSLVYIYAKTIINRYPRL